MILASILTMVGLGFLFAGILALANQKLKVEEDPRVEELTQKLPGLNCGACGFPSCREFAKGIVERKEEALETMCRVAGPEIVELVSKIAGIKKEILKRIAVAFCGAENKNKTRKAIYKGINTCRSAEIIFGGGMSCQYGCPGFGDCAKACPFNAITMMDGLPRVDPTRCVACGNCVKACPRGIIELMPYDVDNLVVPLCRSKDKGVYVKNICSVGCIACKICEKLSGGVFFVEDNFSRLRPERMKEKVSWDQIIDKCPTKTIVRVK